MSTTEVDETDPAYTLEAKEIALNRNINEMISLRNSPVQQFFAGAVVLVTGASGFLGKQLIEKLFRSCEIRKMYIVLRNKEYKSFKERADEITKDILYDNLRKMQPDFLDRLIPVPGDISEIRLGMTDQLWNCLADEVTVIFHVAATVNFVEPLKKAVLTNVRGTREMIKLAQECKKLKSFVHVSTAFSHAVPERVNQPVLERFYDSPIAPDLLMRMVEEIDERKIDQITPILLGSWPNTYSFTKAVAEEVVRTMSGDLPISIVRPAVVMPAFREPPGWVDRSTMNGPVGFIAGACLGGLHVMFANPDNTLDTVPVDMVNNACILAAVTNARERCDSDATNAHERCVSDATKTRERCGSDATNAHERCGSDVTNEHDRDIKIYTVTNNRNSLSIGTLHRYLESPEGRSLITPTLLWYGYVIMTTNRVMFFLITWLLHFIPGYLVDGVLMLCGMKPKITRLFERAYKHNTIFGYYMNHSWKFDDSNLYSMYKNQSPADQIIYHCDMSTVEIFRYMAICCIGTRKYIFKDGLQNTRYAVKKSNILRILNYIYLAVYAYLLWKLGVLLFGVLYKVFVSIFRV